MNLFWPGIKGDVLSMNDKILLVEDEPPIAESVAYSLKSEGFTVEIAFDGLDAISAFRSFSPDLIVLDLMLPRLSGIEVCRNIRKESNVPIIMLTAKSDELDRIVGLEMGADDYVLKPFSTRELIARIRAVLRRAETIYEDEHSAALHVGGIDMDMARRRVSVDGVQMHLPLKQFELLKVLMMNKDKVLSREDLFRKVWDVDAVYDTSSLDVHVRWLREKIEKDPSHPRYIRTVRGIGYRIVDNK